MTPFNIFITGASGCIGHYVTELLLERTNHNLFVLVRNPEKLTLNAQNYGDRLTVIPGNLHDLNALESLLATMDLGILMATAWGDPQETYQINVVQTHRLIDLILGAKGKHIFYFSTESILDQNNTLLPQAGELGTDYIRTKYLCYQQLQASPWASKITVLFPTLVFGGDDRKPLSHLTGGLAEIRRWLWLIRGLTVDGSFHFLHAQDIAQVLVQLVQEQTPDHPKTALGIAQSSAPETAFRQVILGNPSLTVNQAIREICAQDNVRVGWQIPLSIPLANFLIWLFRIRMAPWDYFCLQYRHFVHADAVNPASFGLSGYAETIADLLRVSPSK